MELIKDLRHYLHQYDGNLRIPKYEWEILDYLPVSAAIPKFTAKRSNCEKAYYCHIMNDCEKDKYLPLYRECEKYKSIVSLDDIITIKNITCIFYEKGEIIENPIDEKKLIEMFVELNAINLSESDVLIYYYNNEIIFKDDSYQIYPSAIYEKERYIDDYCLIEDIDMIFKKFNLSLKDKIEEIKLDIRRKKLHVETAEDRVKYSKEDFLNKSLKMLL